MEYVKSIIRASDGVSVDSAIMQLNDGSYKLVDSNGGVVSERALIGLGLNSDFEVIACRHTQKTAKFHDFVEGSFGRINNEDSILIGMLNSDLAFYGPYGSVVQWRCDIADKPMYCPLYDFCVALCRAFDWDFTEFRGLSFDNNVTRRPVCIKISQTAEAQRFYAKMKLDIVGDYAKHLRVVK